MGFHSITQVAQAQLTGSDIAPSLQILVRLFNALFSKNQI